ncbi:MAG: UbiX family flavin prenyltransferase [Verrucomicrobiae bacterium]|nr:UbiX family flavin prenyltransferase [Verrucomicrobiae bacterium]
MKKRIVVGITGASGSIYGIRLLEVLAGHAKVETHLVISRGAEETLRLENPAWSVDRVKSLASAAYSPEDLSAPISSGSFSTHGMAIIPCSMKTLGAVANSLAGDLLSRAADVTLKERRILIVSPRETPLHLGHLRQMAAVTEMGGVILPPIPAFYHQPKTVDDLINHTVSRVLDLFGIENQLIKRWGA